jgi:hypothetical protein
MAAFSAIAARSAAEALGDQSRVRIAQFEWRRDADRAEVFRQPLGDPPKIGQLQRASVAACASGFKRRHTPPIDGVFFAVRLATFSSVVVGAMPTETGEDR